jgi:hypothetical protein
MGGGDPPHVSLFPCAPKVEYLTTALSLVVLCVRRERRGPYDLLLGTVVIEKRQLMELRRAAATPPGGAGGAGEAGHQR